jgi:hypothetical protein
MGRAGAAGMTGAELGENERTSFIAPEVALPSRKVRTLPSPN